MIYLLIKMIASVTVISDKNYILAWKDQTFKLTKY